MEYSIPLAGGRQLLVRSCALGSTAAEVQVAIVSTRGNIIEAGNVAASDILGLCRVLGKAGREALEQLAEFNADQEAEARRSWRENLEANPWLRETRIGRERRGLR